MADDSFDKCDVWAAGLMLFSIVNIESNIFDSETLRYDNDYIQRLVLNRRYLGSENPHRYSKELVTMLKAMIHFDKDQRPNASKLPIIRTTVTEN